MDMPDTVESGVTDSYRNALRDAMAYDNGMDEIKFAKGICPPAPAAKWSG